MWYILPQCSSVPLGEPGVASNGSSVTVTCYVMIRLVFSFTCLGKFTVEFALDLQHKFYISPK